MSRLWLLRHAPTDAAPGLCYGKTDVDAPAEATLAVAQRAIHLVPAGIVLRCSPLRRCADLGRAIGMLRPGSIVQTDPRLAEMDFGAWEGRPWSSIPRAEFEAWTARFADACPGGDGESTRRFMQRVGEAFDQWQASGQDALWVTHAGVMRAAQLLQRGMRSVERADEWPSAPMGYGELLVIDMP